MLFEKDNPCTKDCPDRPNCKGCQRGNAWRETKIAEHNQRSAEADFNHYWFSRYNKSRKRAEKFNKGEIK